MKHLTAIVLTLGVASPLFAQDAAMAALDLDGDGTFSLAELQVPYPSLTEDAIVMLDVNESGLVEPDELTVAIEKGLLPALPEG